MDLQLRNKTALILGGSKGIGRGIADALAAEGVAVAMLARNREVLDNSVSEIKSRGKQFHAMVLPLFRITDLLIPDMRARKWGRVLNVASLSVIEPIPTIGVSNTLRSAIVGWAKTLSLETARDGITVNTLLPGVIATDRSIGLSRAAAERQKITVEEAIKRTAQSIPVGRLGTPEEFGAVAAFLASPLAAYITGSLIRIDGGLIKSV